MVKLPDYDSGHDVRGTLAVEIPLIVLAFATVVLRLWSRLMVKRKLATDDVLITLGLVGLLRINLVDLERIMLTIG